MTFHWECHPIPHFTFKGSLVDPRLRASNEHILIVRVPRAGGQPGLPIPSFGGRALREHGDRSSNPAPFFSKLLALMFQDDEKSKRKEWRQPS